jgi:RimJ/RimL family protein N-acetyltransferase
VLDKGHQRGFRLAQVTTYIGNTAATLVYEKAGFRIAEEKRHPDFERLMEVPGLVRYERNL